MLTPALQAQEEVDTADPQAEQAEQAEGDGRWGTLYAEYGSWVAQPVGLGYTPATQFTVDPLTTQLLHLPHGTEDRTRVRVGYEFKNGIGEFMLTWYSHEDLVGMTRSSPSVFQWGETLVNPINSGFGQDGLADAFESFADTKIRDLRLDYYRPAFSNPRASAKWFVGVRRFFHRREQEAAYFALIPDLPVLLPPVTLGPRPDLVPLPDVAHSRSDYNGRGAEAGIDFEVPLFKERLVLEAGVLVAVLRGRVKTEYQSVTHFYGVIDPNGLLLEILTPPYAPRFLEPDPDDPDIPLVQTKIRQFSTPVGMEVEGLSMSGHVLETHLGFRWRAWKGLEVLGGFRNVNYENVGMEIRPSLFPEQPQQSSHSVGYEGFYGAIAYTY